MVRAMRYSSEPAVALERSSDTLPGVDELPVSSHYDSALARAGNAGAPPTTTPVPLPAYPVSATRSSVARPYRRRVSVVTPTPPRLKVACGLITEHEHVTGKAMSLTSHSWGIRIAGRGRILAPLAPVFEAQTDELLAVRVVQVGWSHERYLRFVTTSGDWALCKVGNPRWVLSALAERGIPVDTEELTVERSDPRNIKTSF